MRGPIPQLDGAFRQRLRELGYVEGQNITIEHRSAEGQYDRLPALATELVRLKVDVIVTAGTQVALAAKHATKTIPIVFLGINDPVGSGLVADLARPGDNITGLSLMAPELSAKRLELLKEAIPGVTRIAVLANPTNPSHAPIFRDTEVASRSLGFQLQLLEVRDPKEFDRAFSGMTRKRADALIVLADPMFTGYREKIVNLAAKHRLPAMFGLTGFVEVGGLMFYGPKSIRKTNRLFP